MKLAAFALAALGTLGIAGSAKAQFVHPAYGRPAPVVGFTTVAPRAAFVQPNFGFAPVPAWGYRQAYFGPGFAYQRAFYGPPAWGYVPPVVIQPVPRCHWR